MGDYSQPGEYLNLQTSYAPYTKGEFDGITSGKVLPVGGDFFKSYSKNGTIYSELDIDLVMLTDGGEKIFCKASGILNYEIDTFKPIKFETQWRFMTSSKEFSYLNEVIAIGLGSFLILLIYICPAKTSLGQSFLDSFNFLFCFLGFI